MLPLSTESYIDPQSMIGVGMARIHNVIGRRLVACHGILPMRWLEFHDQTDVAGAIADMGLVEQDGALHWTKEFQAGWDPKSKTWNPKPCQLYRFYGDEGELLYIGISGRMHERVKQHRDSSSWFVVAASVKIEHHPNRQAALEAEQAAIKAEHPKYNVVHNQRPGGMT